MIQPWRLLAAGFLRGWFGAALGGFALGVIRGSLGPDFNPLYIVLVLPLLVWSVVLLIQALYRIELALRRRVIVGTWYIPRIYPYLM